MSLSKTTTTRDFLTCSRCNAQQERPYELTHSTFAQQPFVCENCRCKDCSIVLYIECECGSHHAEPSKEDPKVCSECMLIRARVSNLDPDLLRLRNAEIANQEPVYTIQLTSKIIPYQVSEDVCFNNAETALQISKENTIE